MNKTRITAIVIAGTAALGLGLGLGIGGSAGSPAPAAVGHVKGIFENVGGPPGGCGAAGHLCLNSGTVYFTGDGHTYKLATSGRFDEPLPAGTYSVRGVAAEGQGRSRDVTVTVRSGHTSSVTLACQIS
jgi:hypothetical protein